MMAQKQKLRLVFDTNIWVSYGTRPGDDTFTFFFVDKILRHCVVIVSERSLNELEKTLKKRKFRKISQDAKDALLRYVRTMSTVVNTDGFTVTDCKADEDDNLFLEMALAGKADFIISRDTDLTDLNPWRGIEILGAGEFIRKYEADLLK